MGILLSAILVVFLIAQILTALFLRLEEGSPAKDKDILEMLEKVDYNKIRSKWDNAMYIESTSEYKYSPRIYKTSRWFIYYPYIIDDVGVVPRWYKSRKVIDAKFAELLKGSKYDTNKRKKLGLE